MWRRRWRLVLALALGAGSVTRVEAQTSLAHGDWEMLPSQLVKLSVAATTHGDPTLYRYAPALPPPGPDWKPLTGGDSQPRNPVDIDYLGPHDDYSSDLRSCLTELEFTSFQCTVAVPAGFTIREATLAIGPLDDGARVLVFNSSHANGVVPEDGYVMLGDAKSVDLSRVLVAGEGNRVVVQHLDDCGGQSWLGTVQLEVKGDPGATSARPTWGRLKAMYR